MLSYVCIGEELQSSKPSIYRLNNRNRKKSDRTSDKNHQKRFNKGRKIFCRSCNFVFIKYCKAQEHARYRSRFFPYFDCLREHRRVKAWVPFERSVDGSAFLYFFRCLRNGPAIQDVPDDLRCNVER